MNNLMYGHTNRAQIVQSADALTGNITADGRTLEADGIIGVLGNLDWKALSNASKTAWALNYLGITEDPGSRKISEDFLPLSGGTMTNGATIHWEDTDVSLLGGKNTENGSSLFLSAGSSEYIYLSTNDGISMTNTTADSLKVESSPRADHDVVRYTEVERLVSQRGVPYILSSDEITSGKAGDITIQASNYSNLPRNTIFFVKATKD